MGNLRLYGSTSGYVEIAPPAVGGSQVLTLPTDSVQPGMVLVNKTDFSAVSTVSLNNVFTSAYANYMIAINGGLSTSANLTLRLRVSGTDSTTLYRCAVVGNDGSITAQNSNVNEFLVGVWSTTSASSFTVFSPQIAEATRAVTNTFAADSGTSRWSYVGGGVNTAATSYDGFTLVPASGTVTGTVRVYGLRNS